MRVSLISLVAGAVVLCGGSCSAQAPRPAAMSAPVAAAGAICRPAFAVGSDKLEAGTAFVLDAAAPEGGSVLVSAMHLFGPAGGLDKDIPWAELPARVGSVTCRSISGDSQWRGGRPLVIRNARPFNPDEDKPFVDVSAFPLAAADAAGATHLKLAATAPAVGERVWLVAQVAAGAPRSTLLHAATVAGSDDQALVYAFDNAGLDLTATSGAPVVNAAGEVVGINLGGGEQDKKLMGVGDSLASVRAALASAGKP